MKTAPFNNAGAMAIGGRRGTQPRQPSHEYPSYMPPPTARTPLSAHTRPPSLSRDPCTHTGARPHVEVNTIRDQLPIQDHGPSVRRTHSVPHNLQSNGCENNHKIRSNPATQAEFGRPSVVFLTCDFHPFYSQGYNKCTCFSVQPSQQMLA